MLDISTVINWIASHPQWAYVIIFLAALTESLVVVGLIVPGGVLMFAAGALVATGATSLRITLVSVALGAIAGDATSYWLGRHYRAALGTRWPFNRYPSVFARSTAFFERYGGKSVFFGRFVGPVRPLIPAVAGMLGMPPARFFVANILSALVWAPAYVLPGVVFGASLTLASVVAMRLVALIVLLLMLIWGGFWSIRRSARWLRPQWQRGLAQLQRWARTASSRQSYSLRGMIAAVLDPARPEARALAAFATLLIAMAWAFVSIVEDVLTHNPLVAMDQAVYHLLQALRTPVSDSVMIACTELGDRAVTLPVIVAVLGWLLWQRAWRPAIYWIAAVSVGAVLIALLKTGFALPRPIPLYHGTGAFGFPSGHAAMSSVIYGFLAVLVARELSARVRGVIFAALSVLVGMIAFSRLYLGAHWLSDVLGGLSFGLAWVALLATAYVRRPAPPVAPRGLLLVAGLALLGSAGIHAVEQRALDIERYAINDQTSSITQSAWWQREWQTLPVWRIDIKGTHQQPLTVQWAGSLVAVRSALLAHGWREAVPLGGQNLLLWLDTHRPALKLPLLPHVHDGRHERLALTLPVDGAPDQRVVLRLWPSSKELLERRRPLWIGTVTIETIRRPLAWFNLPIDGRDFNLPRQHLLESLTDVPTRLATRRQDASSHGATLVWDGAVLLARVPE